MREPEPPCSESQLSEAGFDILRSAVNLARTYQITKAAVLRERLLDLYPGMTAEVDEALGAWADYASWRLQ